MNKRPILVTGAHRSGSTWVGNMIAQSPDVCYIKEPFSIIHRPGICNAKFNYHFTYISSQNDSMFYQNILDTVHLKYHIWEDITSIKRIKDFKKFIVNYQKFFIGRTRKSRALFKDPLAIMSSNWLAERFNFQVIVLIRHPAAFVSSLKRLNLHHPFSHFLDQEFLMKDYLGEFYDEIKLFSDIQKKNGSKLVPDLIDQAILLWKIIYSFTLKMKEEHPEWLFLRHEDLSLQPEKKFKLIFNYLQLELTDKIIEKILEHSKTSNPAEARQGEWHRLKRDSSTNVYNWKKRLTQEEIIKIKSSTSDIAKHYYSNGEW